MPQARAPLTSSSTLSPDHDGVSGRDARAFERHAEDRRGRLGEADLDARDRDLDVLGERERGDDLVEVAARVRDETHPEPGAAQALEAREHVVVQGEVLDPHPLGDDRVRAGTHRARQDHRPGRRSPCRRSRGRRRRRGPRPVPRDDASPSRRRRVRPRASAPRRASGRSARRWRGTLRGRTSRQARAPCSRRRRGRAWGSRASCRLLPARAAHGPTLAGAGREHLAGVVGRADEGAGDDAQPAPRALVLERRELLRRHVARDRRQSARGCRY